VTQPIGELAGKTALVTGGARRVGAAIVRCLHGNGATIALHYRSSRDQAQGLRDELNGIRAHSAEIFHGDLCDTPRIRTMVHEVAGTFGGLHILVNNASSFYATPIEDMNEEAFDDLVGTNFKAPLFLAQAAAPYLKDAGGCIINIADIYAMKPLVRYSAYSAAKAALVSITRSLAKELAPEVRVNAVAPGAVLWAEGDTDEAAKEALVACTPLKRVGEPGDIAEAVAFLVARADYMTGQVIKVDGGRAIG
jgi:pteridine reductase